MEQKIDWKTLEGRYLRFKPGVEKTLELTNWTPGSWFGKMGIDFDVLKEDGKKVSKKLTITNRSLILAFKPILLKAEERGLKTVYVNVSRTGERADTRYYLKALPGNKGLL
jgi:hypothetical protein